MVTNKEIIDKLVEYYLTQDPKIVAKCLAALMIDMNRIIYISELSEKERSNLAKRCVKNVEALHNFINNGPNGDLTYSNVPTKED